MGAATVAGWLLVVVLAAVAALLAAGSFAERRVAVRRGVLVNLRDGSALRAVLWARKGRYLVLRDAHLLEPGQGAARMDGEVVVDRDNVTFIQVVP